MHEKPVTQQYPEVKPELPLHYRGVHRLNRDEQGRVKCVACSVCDGLPGQLHRDRGGAARRWPDRDKFPATFVLDELRCIYCGMCEEACPVDAIELTHIYDLTGSSRRKCCSTRRNCSKCTTNEEPPARTRCAPGADGWARRRSSTCRRSLGVGQPKS